MDNYERTGLAACAAVLFLMAWKKKRKHAHFTSVVVNSHNGGLQSHPIINKGDVLEWKAGKGVEEFYIHFDHSPCECGANNIRGCKDHPATCKVGKLDQKTYKYAVTSVMLLSDEVDPCDGCYYMNGSDNQ